MRTTCTVWIPDEEGDGKHRCRRLDECTRVQTRNLGGQILNDHYACSDCRKRMNLPDEDVVLSPGSFQSVRR